MNRHGRRAAARSLVRRRGPTDQSTQCWRPARGAILRQCKVPVFRGDSLDDLKARVRAREKEVVVEMLAEIANGKIRLVAGID